MTSIFANGGVLFPGSVRLASSTEVFQTLSTALPARLRRLPDGETGERRLFVTWQLAVFLASPFSVYDHWLPKQGDEARQPDNYIVTSNQLPTPAYEAREPGEIFLNKTRYDEVAIASYGDFIKLRKEGVIEKDVRFQVCIPTPLHALMSFIKPEYQSRVEPHYEAKLIEAIHNIQAAIPAQDLAIQLDTSIEFAILESIDSQLGIPLTARFVEPAMGQGGMPEVKRQTMQRVERMVNAITFEDEGPEVGFHLCYGDIGHAHFVEPKDSSKLVDVANLIAALPRLENRLSWIHMPVPRDRKDAAYFEPMKMMKLQEQTDLYLGLVHLEDLEGTRERIKAAKEVQADFGVATECGLGRSPREDLDSILCILREVRLRFARGSVDVQAFEFSTKDGNDSDPSTSAQRTFVSSIFASKPNDREVTMVDTVPIVATLGIALLTILSTLLYSPLHEKATILGYLTPRASIENLYGSNSTVFPVSAIASGGSVGSQKPLQDKDGGGLHLIPDTHLCEDLHLHHGSGLLFTACQVGTYESTRKERRSWFPPTAFFHDHKAVERGKLVVIDPTTFKAQDLTIEGFEDRPWVTHGIDIVDSPDETDTIYIFAVNHLPNPDYYTEPPPDPKTAPPRARSQIEIFKHVLHTTTATHVRSIRNTLIATPNDIHAISPKSFYVTNDHHYREPGALRTTEVVLDFAAWSNIVHASITDLSTTDPTAGVVVSTALSGLHNPNGIGHTSRHRDSHELIFTSAAGGVLTRAEIDTSTDSSTTTTNLKRIEDIQIMSTLDNPSYYEDPYASAHSNASGYILAGLMRAADLFTDMEQDNAIPSLVWHVRSNNEDDERHASWEKNVIFQDRGTRMRSATTAVMVPRDPEKEAGKKKAWLFVTGFMADGVGIVGVDL
ncbi:MAG: hypothetical protein M1828_007633 [Chrysothrix sp. TS-e1954]|nr:MAG: hypothetical protein M1828_007633 [Chrysothrix sp. TS-e1954]